MAALLVALLLLTSPAHADDAQRRAELLGRLFDLQAYRQASLLLAGTADAGYQEPPRPQHPARAVTSGPPEDRADTGSRTEVPEPPGRPAATGADVDAVAVPHAPASGSEPATPGRAPGEITFEFEGATTPGLRARDTFDAQAHSFSEDYDPAAALPGSRAGSYHLSGPGPDGWYCPVAGSVRFINDWGFPRSGGRRHQGNDLFAPEGTPLVAMGPGEVVRIQRRDVGLGGRTVTYRSDDGTNLYYAHLHTVRDDLRVGQRVTGGDLLGTVGRTGNARTTPPHLHIGFYANGTAFNPYPTLIRACR